MGLGTPSLACLLLPVTIIGCIWFAADCNGWSRHAASSRVSPGEHLVSAVYRGDLKAIALLIDRGALQDRAAAGHALHLAVCLGNVQTVHMLVDAGVSPDVRDLVGWTPLMIAAQLPDDARLNVASELIGLGADSHATGPAGQTALTLAIAHNNAKIVRLLSDTHTGNVSWRRVRFSGRNVS